MSKAQIVEFLLSENEAAALGTVTFYATGTDTLKTIWLDRDKAVAAANPYTLDINGRAELYAEGIYKIVVKNAAGSIIPNGTIDGVAYGLADGGYWSDASEYASLNSAVAAIGTTPSVLLINTAELPLTANLTVPSTLQLKFEGAGSIAQGTYTLAINSPFNAPLQQVFTGTGAVSFGIGTVSEVYPAWWGAKGDGTTDDTTAVQAAILATPASSETVYQGTPLLASTVTIAGQKTLRAAQAAFFYKKATATGPVILITGSGSTMIGGGVIGQDGNTGDNIQITGRGITLRNVSSYYAGQDGIRVGQDATGMNANMFMLDTCVTSHNGRHGVFIDDKAGLGAPDANGGTILQLDTAYNGTDGIRFGNCAFNTLSGGAFQNNAEYGVRFEGGDENVRIGGDSEANTIGDMYISATSLKNRILGNRWGETVTDMTHSTSFLLSREKRTMNYQTQQIIDNPRNWPFVISGSGVTATTITDITVSGTTATATFSADHGYAEDDTIFMYPMISGESPIDAPFGGPWVVATVPTTSTITFTVPAGMPATAGEDYKCLVGFPTSTTQIGNWQINNDWVTFNSFSRLSTGTMNAAITGNLVIYGLPIYNTIGLQAINIQLYNVANLLNIVPAAAVVTGLKIDVYKTEMSTVAGGAWASVLVSDVVINANTYIGISGDYKAQ